MSYEFCVKICGLKTAADVAACVAADVDLLGFNFYPASARYLSPADARHLVHSLPSHIEPVGIFVHSSPEQVAVSCAAAGLHTAQLHGDEDISRYAHLDLKLIQVLHVDAATTLAQLGAPQAERVLLDARVEGFGGAGKSFDWSLAEAAVKAWPRHKVILAGGLTPENVGTAVARVQPWAVDVASGVELEKGVKDAKKVQAFVTAARAAAEARNKNVEP